MNDIRRTKDQLIKELTALRRKAASLEKKVQKHKEGAAKKKSKEKPTRTHLKQVEEALLHSEKRYRHLVENTLVGIYQTNLGGDLLYANEALSKMLEFESPEDMMAQGVLKKYKNPEDRDFLIKELKKENKIEKFDIELVTRKGKTRHVILSASLNNDIISGMIMDISERKHAEEALRASEAQLSNAMKIAKLGHWEYDADDDLFTFNDQLYSIFSTSVEKVGGYKMSPARYAQLFLHPDDMPLVAIEMKKALETTDPHFSRQLEHRIIYADGGIGYISVHYFVIKDDNGRTIKTYGANQDITERKRAEEALRESEEKYRLLFNAESDAIMAFEGDTRKVIDVNDAAVQLYGYGRGEFLDMFLRDISAEYDKSEKSLQHILAGEIMKIPLRYHRKKDGTVFPVEVSAGLFIMKERKIVIGAIRDISERIEAEEKIKTYHKRLSELASKIALIAEDERRRFADELHDLTGQNLALAKIKLSELRELAANKGIVNQVDELYQLIEEASASTRALTFELSPPILYEIGFEAAAEWLGEQILRKYSIAFHFEDDTQTKPLSDEAKVLLFVSLRELIVNIGKHSKARNATVTLGKAGNMLHVSVTDDGMGFDASDMDFQIIKATSFGLFSTRERVERLGGRLEITSQPGKGTTVTMAVPLKK